MSASSNSSAARWVNHDVWVVKLGSRTIDKSSLLSFDLNRDFQGKDIIAELWRVRQNVVPLCTMYKLTLTAGSGVVSITFSL
jgi:hypothetical protein